MQKHIKIQTKVRANNNSVSTSIPYEFRNAFGLKPGDSVEWESDGDKVTLKFYKVTVERTIALLKAETPTT
jgi:bifunctional DNA-binding transcriptional regulator/antitoxin component of YhaV-PrlF toxin-antitoxin module